MVYTTLDSIIAEAEHPECERRHTHTLLPAACTNQSDYMGLMLHEFSLQHMPIHIEFALCVKAAGLRPLCLDVLIQGRTRFNDPQLITAGATLHECPLALGSGGVGGVRD